MGGAGMTTTNELVYVDVEIYRPGDTEYSEALDEWEHDLWVFPTRPDAQCLSDVLDSTGADEDETAFADLAFHVMPITQPNPAFLHPEWKSHIDWLVEESNADLAEVFEVDAHERWLPVIQRRMTELPSTNRIGFYAVYAVTQTWRKDENDSDSSIEFEYAGELDMTRLPLVQS
jgi:hypothetical protein